MLYKPQVQRLIQSYENKVAWGGQDHEASLQDAINTAFSGLNNEGKAELYARIADAWEGYRDGMVPRKLWIGQIVNEFMSGRAASASSELKVFTNVGGKTDEQSVES